MFFSHEDTQRYAKMCNDVQSWFCPFRALKNAKNAHVIRGFAGQCAASKPLAKCASRLSSGRKCWTSKQSCQAGNCGCLSSLQQLGHASWALRTPCKMRWRNWIFADSAPTYQLVHFDTLTPHQPHPNFEINLQDVIHSKYLSFVSAPSRRRLSSAALVGQNFQHHHCFWSLEGGHRSKKSFKWREKLLTLVTVLVFDRSISTQ